MMDVHFIPVQTNTMPAKQKVKNFIWIILNRSLYRFSPTHFSIFRKWRVLLIKLFGATVDWSCSLHPKSQIEYPWNLVLGKQVSLGENSWVYAMSTISVGDNTCIGKDVYLLTGSHDIYRKTFDLIIMPVSIGKNTWVATRVNVLPGVTIGDNCVIAIGSTVTKDVESNSVVGGNPAKFIKNRVIK